MTGNFWNFSTPKKFKIIVGSSIRNFYCRF